MGEVTDFLKSKQFLTMFTITIMLIAFISVPNVDKVHIARYFFGETSAITQALIREEIEAYIDQGLGGSPYQTEKECTILIHWVDVAATIYYYGLNGFTGQLWDYSTDAEVLIQAAFNYVYLYGGPIVVKPGLYEMGGPLNYSAGSFPLILRGSGAGSQNTPAEQITRFYQIDNFGANYMIELGTATVVSNYHIIEDLVLAGNPSYTGAGGLSIMDVKYGYYRNVLSELWNKVDANGFFITGTSAATSQSNTFINCVTFQCFRGFLIFEYADDSDFYSCSALGDASGRDVTRGFEIDGNSNRADSNKFWSCGVWMLDEPNAIAFYIHDDAMVTELYGTRFEAGGGGNTVDIQIDATAKLTVITGGSVTWSKVVDNGAKTVWRDVLEASSEFYYGYAIKEIWIHALKNIVNNGNWLGESAADSSDSTIRLTPWAMEPDFLEVVDLKYVVLPLGTGNINWRARSQFAGDNEAYNTHAIDSGWITTGVTNNQIEVLATDVSEILTGLEHTDFLALVFNRDSTNVTDTCENLIVVLGAKLRYRTVDRGDSPTS